MGYIFLGFRIHFTATTIITNVHLTNYILLWIYIQFPLQNYKRVTSFILFFSKDHEEPKNLYINEH